MMNRLMLDLGFGNGYVARGGDIGSKVARVIAAEHAARKAVHINFCIMPEPEGVDSNRIIGLEQKGIIRVNNFVRLGSAYALEHTTRPSATGIVASSSPLALLAWIGEKFLEWTDPRTTPQLDAILECVTLYWLTETFPRAIYPYRQLFTPGNIAVHED